MLIMKKNVVMRAGIDQNDNCISIMIIIFDTNKIDVNLFKDINLNGSNAEKMSIIIQNMECPF